LSKVKGFFRELKWFEAVDWMYLSLCVFAWLLLVMMFVGSVVAGSVWILSFALAVFVLVGVGVIVNASKFAIQCNKDTARYRRSR
jgi:hypothetical protein